MTFISRSWCPPQYECFRTLGKSSESAKGGRTGDVAAAGPRAPQAKPDPVVLTSHTVTDSFERLFKRSLPPGAAVGYGAGERSGAAGI
jgi:hypothetical protein